jgi:ABC-type transporter Mla subunit MlaD
MIVSEELRESELLPEAEKTLKQSQVWLAQMPQLLAQLNQTLVKTDGMLTQAQSTLTTYGQPTELVKEITDSQLPLVLHNLNANLTVMQQMLKDVHGEREQFALTVHSVQQVLEQMEKTLEALNNHPVFRDGISTPVKNGEIEMHD